MIMVQCVQKILNGQPPRKTVKSWRLEGIVETINGLLNKLEYVVVQHTKTRGNKVADFLANLGCRLRDLDLDEK